MATRTTKVKKTKMKMKRVLKLILLILIPLLLQLVLMCVFTPFSDNEKVWGIYNMISATNFCLSCVYIPFLMIYGYLAMICKEFTAKQSAIINLIIRLILSVLYIFNGIVACLGIFASVWAIGVWVVCAVIFISAYSMSCVQSIGFVIRMNKDRLVKQIPLSICLSIASFLIGLDIVAAIVYVVFTVKKEKEDKQQVVTADKTGLGRENLRKAAFVFHMFIISALPYTYLYFTLWAGNNSMPIAVAIIYWAYSLYAAVMVITQTYATKIRVSYSSLLNLVTKLTYSFGCTLLIVAIILLIKSNQFSILCIISIIFGVAPIIITGLVAAGCINRLKRDEIISLKGAVALVILSFIPLADIVAAIIFLVKSDKTENADTQIIIGQDAFSSVEDLSDSTKQ